jgi:hypothetical protein
MRNAAGYGPLASEKRDAMAWVRQHHAGSAFVMISDQPWYSDISAEWFPVLAGAESLNTVQGREWLPNRAFARSAERHAALLKSKSCPELLEAIRGFGKSDFVWTERLDECFSGDQFQKVFENSEVTIFRAAGRMPITSPSQAPVALQ